MDIGMRLTRLGKMLLAKALTGELLTFSSVKIGSGDFDYNSESVYDLTELRHYEMTLPITDCVVKGDGTACVVAYLSNAEVLEGFAATEHGVFALDDNGNEILFAYRNVGNDYDFIPSFAGSALKNLYIEYIVEVRDAENITATIDLSVAYVCTDDFKNHINSQHPHLNTPNHYLDVDSADCIWATDNDNDLHKLALADLKAMLADDSVATASRDETFLTAKENLGLDANVLMVEDFTGDKTFDTLKIKVTSCTIGGKFIGLEAFTGVVNGGVYTISDGIFSENVTVKAVKKNEGGIHIEIARGLDFTYDLNATYLYRSYTGGSKQVTLTFNPVGFAGYEANVERLIEMSTFAQDYRITGAGKIVEGSLTI